MAELELTLGADPAEVTRLRETIEAFAESTALSESVAFKLTLALDELVTNAIEHGFAGIAAPEIRVRIRIDDGCVFVQLRDNGIAFDPFAGAPEPQLDLPLAERPVGGLGVHLVRNLIEQVSYRRDNGFNRIDMTLRPG